MAGQPSAYHWTSRDLTCELDVLRWLQAALVGLVLTRLPAGDPGQPSACPWMYRDLSCELGMLSWLQAAFVGLVLKRPPANACPWMSRDLNRELDALRRLPAALVGLALMRRADWDLVQRQLHACEGKAHHVGSTRLEARGPLQATRLEALGPLEAGVPLAATKTSWG